MNTQSPKVSIGLPVYNRENYVQETLDSILAQTFQDFEIIISDNASIDRTQEICREYAARDSRIRYYQNEKNIGIFPNHNRAFELATGDYFKWIGADDLIAPEYLEKCVEVLDQFPSATLCYTKERIIDENGEPIYSGTSYFVDFQCSRCHQRFKDYIDIWKKLGYIQGNAITGLIRADKLRMTPLFGKNLSPELGLIGELILLGDVYEVPEELMFFRVHTQSSRAIREQGLDAFVNWGYSTNSGKVQRRVEWGLLNQLCNSIQRVPMSYYERLFCYIQMAKWASWKWKRLLRELVNPNRLSF